MFFDITKNMMLGGVLADGQSFQIAGSWFFTLVAIATLLLPFVALAFALWSWRRSRRDGSTGIGWISAALIISRFFLGSLALALVLSATNPSNWSSSGLDDRYEIEHDWYDDDADRMVEGTRLTVRLPGVEIPLCPNHLVPAVRGGKSVQLYEERECWARRELAKTWGGEADVDTVVLQRRVIDPPSSTTRGDGLLAVLRVVSVVLLLIALERILASAAARRPFARRNIWWLRGIALSALLLGTVEPWLRGRYADGLARQFFGSEASYALDHNPDLHLTGLAGAVLILAIGEVWAYGIRLQREAEATV